MRIPLLILKLFCLTYGPQPATYFTHNAPNQLMLQYRVSEKMLASLTVHVNNCYTYV